MSSSGNGARCRLCRTGGLEQALVLSGCSGNISRLLQPDEIGLIPRVAVEVFECQACGFVQLTNSLREGFYDDYVMATSFSPQMQQFQRDQAATFVARYGLNHKRVVEVGCGDGTYLQRLATLGVNVAGIEPSKRFRELALQKGLQVFPGYVQEDAVVPDGPYDGFVTRQVLEHVLDIHGFLRGIRKSIVPGGVGLVEVPSLEQAIEGGRFYDFFPDHLNYFCARSLGLALESNGFVVDEITRGMDGEYNVASVHLDRIREVSKLGVVLDRVKKQLIELIESEVRQGRRVAVWGAGGKGNVVLSVVNIQNIAYIVDSDPLKHGLFTPATHYKVVPPEMLTTDPVDTVVITALAYLKEIVGQLKGPIGFKGRIIVLGSDLRNF
jgi:SAM-dependent methyltransferase